MKKKRTTKKQILVSRDTLSVISESFYMSEECEACLADLLGAELDEYGYVDFDTANEWYITDRISGFLDDAHYRPVNVDDEIELKGGSFKMRQGYFEALEWLQHEWRCALSDIRIVDMARRPDGGYDYLLSRRGSLKPKDLAALDHDSETVYGLVGDAEEHIRCLRSDYGFTFGE